MVLGHWLVTAIVLGPDGALRTASPLDAVPVLRPASWLFQTLGLFFLVAGFAATAAHDRRAAARPPPAPSPVARRPAIGGRAVAAGSWPGSVRSPPRWSRSSARWRSR